MRTTSIILKVWERMEREKTSRRYDNTIFFTQHPWVEAFTAHRSDAWKRSYENVLMESRMTGDLGHTRPRKYVARSNVRKWGRETRDVSSTCRPENNVETAPFIHVCRFSHLMSNAQLSRAINSDRSRRYLTGQKVGSCSECLKVGRTTWPPEPAASRLHSSLRGTNERWWSE